MTKPTIDNILADGWKTIHKAAYCGNYEVLLDELNKGISPNDLTNNFSSIYNPAFKKKRTIYFDNITPLYLAAQKGHNKCIRLLINRGADPNIIAINTDAGCTCSAKEVALWCFKYKSYKIMKKGPNKDGLLSTVN